MRSLAILVLILAVPPISATQAELGGERPANLQFSVVPQARKRGVDMTSDATPSTFGRNPVDTQVSRTEKGVNGLHDTKRGSYVLNLHIHARNIGQNKVTKIQGQLLIIEDGREVARLGFANKGGLRAQQEKVVAKLDLALLPLPVRDRFSADLENGTAVARVRVERVEYADGSIWLPTRGVVGAAPNNGLHPTPN